MFYYLLENIENIRNIGIIKFGIKVVFVIREIIVIVNVVIDIIFILSL